MKRKLIALALTLTTIFACFSMTMISAETANDGAEAPALEAPVVEIGGHQRTIVAGDTYGIRLVGLISNLNATEVGFDITLVKNDGTKATVNQPITNVYTSITGQVNGVDTEITAASLGSSYIFTVVIPDVLTSEAYMGYSFSVYYKMGDDKTSSDTYKFVYKGSEHYVTYVVGDKVQPTYDSCSTGTWSDWAYVDGATDRTQEAIDADASVMWDGVVDTAYGGFNHTDQAYTQAEFNEPTVIGRIKLSSIYRVNNNKGAKIQASVNGADWDDLYTIEEEKDAAFFANGNGWAWNYLTIDVAKTTAYSYIRILGAYNAGFSLCEVEVFEAIAVEGEEMLLDLSDESKQTSSTGTSSTWKYACNNKQEADSSNRHLSKWLWNGHIGYAGWEYYGIIGTGAYSAVEFDNSTVITKVTVAASACASYNADQGGAQIQASVNGQDWDTLHTFKKGVSAEEDAFLVWAWSHNPVLTFTFEVNKPTTEYNHIRVFGNQYCLSEISVYGITVAYSADFAAALNAA